MGRDADVEIPSLAQAQEQVAGWWSHRPCSVGGCLGQPGLTFGRAQTMAEVRAMASTSNRLNRFRRRMTAFYAVSTDKTSEECPVSEIHAFMYP